MRTVLSRDVHSILIGGDEEDRLVQAGVHDWILKHFKNKLFSNVEGIHPPLDRFQCRAALNI
jgi:hypothetical protein